MRDIYYEVKNGVRNLIWYFDVIWNDSDWDYTYIIKLLHRKLESIESRENLDDVRDSITLCRRLSARIMNEDYEAHRKIGPMKDYIDPDTLKKDVNKWFDYSIRNDIRYLMKMLGKHIRTWWS